MRPWNSQLFAVSYFLGEKYIATIIVANINVATYLQAIKVSALH